MDVSVVIPARNAAATIGRTLAAVAAQDFDGEYETIVVDDGSTDGTIEVVRRTPDVRLLEQKALGPGAARNLGARSATAAILAFTDADCFPIPQWLREGVAAMSSADLVQGRVLADPKATRGPFDRTIWITYDTGLYETANLFVRRDELERAGGFEDWLDVRIGKCLGEDVWLGWKLRRRGARPAFAEGALVHHEVFERSASQFVFERLRLVYFPDMVAKVPELRHHFLYGGWFLSERSAAFDAAVLGAAATVASSRKLPSVMAAAPLVLALPYARMLLRRARDLRGDAPVVIPVEVAADAVGFAALVTGSARRRELIL